LGEIRKGVIVVNHEAPNFDQERDFVLKKEHQE
jgi:hypothetical protein